MLPPSYHQRNKKTYVTLRLAVFSQVAQMVFTVTLVLLLVKQQRLLRRTATACVWPTKDGKNGSVGRDFGRGLGSCGLQCWSSALEEGAFLGLARQASLGSTATDGACPAKDRENGRKRRDCWWGAPCSGSAELEMGAGRGCFSWAGMPIESSLVHSRRQPSSLLTGHRSP
jgi:hypothetical protein